MSEGKVKRSTLSGLMSSRVRDHWQSCHLNNKEVYLTGTSLKQYLEFFDIHVEYEKSHKILEIGIGLTKATNNIFEDGKEIYAADLSIAALNKVSHFAHTFQLSELNKLPPNSIDVAISFLVAQHITDKMLVYHLTHVLPSLKEGGIFCLQYLAKHGPHQHSDQGERIQEGGGVMRNPSEVERIVTSTGGTIVRDHLRASGTNHCGIWQWRSAIISEC